MLHGKSYGPNVLLITLHTNRRNLLKKCKKGLLSWQAFGLKVEISYGKELLQAHTEELNMQDLVQVSEFKTSGESPQCQAVTNMETCKNRDPPGSLGMWKLAFIATRKT